VTGPLVWVIGRGGFLGSQLERLARLEIAGATSWAPSETRFSWTAPDRLVREMADAAHAFTEEARRQGRPWMTVWSATAGGVGTSPGVLQHETDALRGLLGSLGAALGRGGALAPGTLLFCSSAGGVYGQALELPLTESSPCHPISAYGQTKLDQETEVLRWARETPGVSCLVARLSNLYGPGQSLAGSTGLIARLSQSLLHRRPLHVYVPLDTLRDYLHVGDAARYLCRCLDRLMRLERPTSLVKIFASEQSISIAGLIGIFTRVAKHPPRIVCMPDAVSRQQPSRLRFRSLAWADRAPRMLDLAAGIAEVYQDHLRLFQRGRLPAPPQR
jgi:UDP-glucose 4-epimerase